ncbi:baseplate assembly protein [Asaia sp. W19]|uniref:baseplate assembly protein n=1 Tax=unclassified Asaia TaxID=2685023 RepID=UPI000F8E35B8|nr:baseplate assembly protein [Asaia sp. W19]RUT27439.1 baseplate assembly protein [Asaia sp. W19]
MQGSQWAAAHQLRMAHAVHGIISAVDPANHAVKVRVQPDDIETGWLPDAAMTQVGDLRLSCPTAPGAHVLLMPVEGDGENYVIVSVLFDVVAGPAISPHTGKCAQPGELLIRAGCGVPSRPGGRVDEKAGWFHLGRDGVFFGAGSMQCALTDTGIVLRVGSMKMRLDSTGLSFSGGDVSVSGGGISVSGGDVKTDLHSLGGHVHPYANGMTGKAVG